MLNPVLETNPDALKIAEQRDRDRQEGKTLGYIKFEPLAYVVLGI